MTTARSRVRVAVQIAPERADYAAVRRAASGAEALGVDAIFNWDHFFPLGKDRTGKHFECWTMLGAWAESTARAEIGAMVSCVVGGDPWLVAPPLRERGVGMFTVITRGPDYGLDELRRWLGWRERIESHQN